MILSLLDTDDPRVIFGGEKCGLSAAVNVENASYYALLGQILMEHRGEKGCGMASVHESQMHHIRKRGPVSLKFDGIDLEKELPGTMAIGHNRYATAGDSDSIKNVQPFVVMETKYGPIAVAHNGTLIDYQPLKKNLIDQGAAFQSNTDSEVFIHLITRSSSPNIEGAVLEALEQMKAAYSLLIMTRDQLFAIRDRFGVRPLNVATLRGGYLVFSENFPFGETIPESKFLREVEPGEMLVFENANRGFRSVRYAEADEYFCSFECIYFSHPRDTYHGTYHEDFQQELGFRFHRDNPDIRADAIVPLLDSGKQFAIGLSKATGIPFKEYVMRNHIPLFANKRSFTSATYAERAATALLKQLLRADKVRGKRLLVADDSIIRALTIKSIIERLKDAGTEWIGVAISAPPAINICNGGMDFQTSGELIAHNQSIEEIRQFIKADWLMYQSPAGLDETLAKTYKCRGFCTGCFGGKYPPT